MNAPSGREGLAKSFNMHGNRLRTRGGAVKRASRHVYPIEEMARIINEAQDRDAQDER